MLDCRLQVLGADAPPAEKIDQLSGVTGPEEVGPSAPRTQVYAGADQPKGEGDAPEQPHREPNLRKSACRNFCQIGGLEAARAICERLDEKMVGKYQELGRDSRKVEDEEHDGSDEHECKHRHLDGVIVNGRKEVEAHGLNDKHDQPEEDQPDSAKKNGRADLQEDGHSKPGHIPDIPHRHGAREHQGDQANREKHNQYRGGGEDSLTHRLDPDEGSDFTFQHEITGDERRHFLLGYTLEEGKKIGEVGMLGRVVEVAVRPEVQGLGRQVFSTKALHKGGSVRLEFVGRHNSPSECPDLLLDDGFREIEFVLIDGALNL